MRRLANSAWVLVFALGLIVVLFSFGALFMGVDPNEFQQSTGIAWTNLQESTPTVASYVVRLERLIGVGYVVIGVLWSAVAFSLLRRGMKVGWYILWSMPIVFAGASIVFFAHQAVGLGAYYAAFSLVSVAGLLLALPSIRSAGSQVS